MRCGPIRLSAAPVAAGKRHTGLPEAHMLDVLMIGFALIFFALAVGYTFLCDRL
jgi:hypothetical protein